MRLKPTVHKQEHTKTAAHPLERIDLIVDLQPDHEHPCLNRKVDSPKSGSKAEASPSARCQSHPPGVSEKDTGMMVAVAHMANEWST